MRTIKQCNTYSKKIYNFSISRTYVFMYFLVRKQREIIQYNTASTQGISLTN